MRVGGIEAKGACQFASGHSMVPARYGEGSIMNPDLIDNLLSEESEIDSEGAGVIS